MFSKIFIGEFLLQDEEYLQMGLDCIRKAYELLESPDWKVEKVNKKGDTIRSKQKDKLGKIFRMTVSVWHVLHVKFKEILQSTFILQARIKYPAKELLQELFYKIEEVPKWNPTLLESRIVRVSQKR